MKIIYIHILIILNFNNCIAQQNKNEIMVPEITKEFEKFDIEKFDIENENILISKGDYDIIELTQSYGYISKYYYKNSFFTLIKKFYSNYGIKQKGILINEGDQIKIWYEFDEQGNLIKEIDTDEGYTFSWEQIIEYCENNKIELTKGYIQGGYQTNIFKEELEGKKVWVISHLLSPILVSKKTLDGITGELIKEEELEFINH